MKPIVIPSICIASRVAIFYSISPDNQRLHDTLLLEQRTPEMAVGRQRGQLNFASAISKGLCCCRRGKKERENTEQERPDRRKKKSLIEGEGGEGTEEKRKEGLAEQYCQN